MIQKTLKNLIFFLFLCFLWRTTKCFKDYDFNYRNYEEILNQIKDLSIKYPFNMIVYDNVQENISIPDVENCGNDKCSYNYFILSDFSQSEEKISQLPQIFFVAGIHGDEIVGPNVVISLAKYILENYQTNETLKYYIQNRLMIFFPMSNPIGYYYKQREELHNGGVHLDPNRDFPYNVNDIECFRTATAIMINHIYQKYLIKTAISFHGGDNSITYPWGGYNHVITKYPHIQSELAPDNQALFEIANDLVSIADENPSKGIDKYSKGTMNEVVYPVNGGLEDWAYGGGWENFYSKNKVIPSCKQFDNPENLIQTNTSHIKSVLFLVECGDPKDPSSDTLGKVSGLNDKNEDNWGHITRNIALSLNLIKISAPFIKNNDINFLDYSAEINWEAQGCFKVSSTFLLWKVHNPLEGNDFQGKNLSYVSSLHKWQQTTNLIKNDTDYIFKYKLDFTSSIDIDVLIVLQCDKDWGNKNNNSAPLSPPQSHLALARTQDKYHVENNGFVVNSEKTVYKYLEKININYIGQIFYKKSGFLEKESIVIQARFHKCFQIGSRFEENNKLIFSSNSEEDSINVQGNIKYFNNNFQAFLFFNGDISYCDASHLGKNLDDIQTLNLSLNILNYDESLKIFIENKYYNDSFSFKIAQNSHEFSQKKIDKLLGRSILLYSDDRKDYLISQLTLLQNYQCEQEAKSCKGFSLNEHDGICLLMNEFKFKEREDFLIKISLINNYKNKTLDAKIIVNIKSLMNLYDTIDKIVIKNENYETEFLINKENFQSNIFLSDAQTFLLDPNFALSNKILIIGENAGRKTKIGLCDIVIQENAIIYSENEEIILGKEETNLVIIWLAGSACVILLLAIIFYLKKILKERNIFANGNENKQLIMENHKTSEIIDAMTITPKFLDIDHKQNSPQTLNEEMDSDKI